MPPLDPSHPDPTQDQEQNEPVPGVQAQDESSVSATSMNVDKENVGFMT